MILPTGKAMDEQASLPYFLKQFLLDGTAETGPLQHSSCWQGGYSFLKRHSCAWVDKNKPRQTLYTCKQSSQKLEAHFGHISHYSLILTLQADPTVLQKTQQHTEKCFLLSFPAPHLNPSFCSYFQISLSIINGSELTKRCLSKYRCYHYGEGPSSLTLCRVYQKFTLPSAK